MTHAFSRLSSAAVPVLLLACTLSEDPKAGPGAALAQVEVAEPLDAKDAETPWRWIGAKNDLDRPGCPEARGWQARPLFAQDDDSPLPAGLAPFCLYESRSGAPAELERLVARRKLAAVAPDHMAVGPSANELKRAVWEELRDHFLEQAGDVDLPFGQGIPPRLAFADTGPTDDVAPEDGWNDNSPHGYSLVNMAKDLLCDPAGNCLARVTSRLALPHTDLSPDRHPGRGGFIGTLGELAVAVRREVHEWKTAAAGEPLIVNLSLGWDGGLFGGEEALPDDMPLDVRAVYRALEDAVCRGALVVAAAGNLGGGPGPETGPLHPAAWERRPAPGLKACEDALQGSGAPDPSLWPADYWPLVYAAGGVDFAGRALANARPGGEPGLAAFADHAVVDDGRSVPTALLTGTSVGAAVVSAAAAAVWYYRPGEKPHGVMKLVYEGSAGLGRDAQFCLGGAAGKPCPQARLEVRRVSVCAAVAEACDAGGGACPASLPACPAAGALDLSGADLAAFLATPPVAVDLADASFSATFQACGGETLYYNVRPPDPCPHHQYHGLAAEHWNRSQPGSNPCSSCYMDADLGTGIAAAAGTATLYLEIDPDFLGLLTSPTLIVGSEAYNLDPASNLAAGDRAVVENVPTESGTPILLTFTLNGTRSALCPVLVVEN